MVDSKYGSLDAHIVRKPSPRDSGWEKRPTRSPRAKLVGARARGAPSSATPAGGTGEAIRGLQRSQKRNEVRLFVLVEGEVEARLVVVDDVFERRGHAVVEVGSAGSERS